MRNRRNDHETNPFAAAARGLPAARRLPDRARVLLLRVGRVEIDAYNETDFVIDVQDGAVVTSGLTGFQQFGFQTAELYDENLTEAEFPLAEPIAIPNVSEIVEANQKQ